MKNRTFDEINEIYQKHVNEHKTIPYNKHHKNTCKAAPRKTNIDHKV